MTPLANKLLTKRVTLDILEAITSAPLSAKEIADAAELELGFAWRFVQRLTEAKLVRVVGSRRRNGRAQKLYQVSAREFFIPASDRHRLVSSELASIVDQQLDVKDQAVGERFYFDGGRWRVEKRYEAGADPDARQHDRWLLARLPAHERRNLLNEIDALLETYAGRQHPSARRSLIRFACVDAPASF